MEWFIYHIARIIVRIIQSLPLRWVARIGRGGGALAYLLDMRHRRVAYDNIKVCFGAEMPPARIQALTREHFRRLGENYACSIRTASMSNDEIGSILTVVGGDKIKKHFGSAPGSCVIAIGHFGNFELYARANLTLPQFQFATTYRALRQPSLNRLFQDIRSRSGCLYFERRTESAQLKEALAQRPVMLGLLSDQHASGRGIRIPFLGHDCSTTPAPAIYALRYGVPLFTAICYRVALGKWEIEIGDEIPTHEDGRPRTLKAIAIDINKALEVGVRRDPANWFWVHRRWKAPRPGRPIRPA